MSRRNHRGLRVASRNQTFGLQGVEEAGPKARVWQDIAEQAQRGTVVGTLAEVAVVAAVESDDDFLAPDPWGPLEYTTETSPGIS
jgi:hypothetical protein